MPVDAPPGGSINGWTFLLGGDMAAKDTDGRRPTGNSGRNRNAFCSFCRKSHRDVGPLVEGPGDVYICGECIDLCSSIIDQEKKRRNTGKAPAKEIPAPRTIKEKLDAYVVGQQRAKKRSEERRVGKECRS